MNKSSYTEAGILRGCAMFDTYEAKIHLNKNNSIVGLQSQAVNKGELIGESSSKTISSHVGNVVKSIIENKNFESLSGFLNELDLAYSRRITMILKSQDESNVTKLKTSGTTQTIQETQAA